MAALITLLGPAIRLSHWVLDVSPFSHVPKLPGAPVTAAPLAWLVAVAVVLAVTGLAGSGGAISCDWAGAVSSTAGHGGRGACEWGPSEYESRGPTWPRWAGLPVADILARCGRPPGMGSSH